MSNNKFLAKKTFVVSLILCASSILGLLRESAITYMFGATGKTDAYFVSLTIPSLFIGIISASVTNTFITVYSSLLAKGEKEKANKTTNCILTIFFVLLFALSTLLFIFSNEAIKLVAPNYIGEKLDLSIQLLRILLPNIIFGGILGILVGVNNSNNSFLAPASIGLVLNLAMIIGILFLGKYFGIYALAISNSVGIALQLLIQIPSTKKFNFKFKFIFDVKDEGLLEMIKLVVPFIISAVVGQLNLIIDRNFATSFSEGVVSSLYLSGKLVLLPQTVFGAALSTIILPSLVSYATNKNWKEMFDILQKGINLIFFMLAPCIVIFLTLSVQIVEILFEHGKFTTDNTALTASLIPYLIGVMFFGAIWSVLNNIYYATKKVKYIVFTSVMAVLVKVLLSFLLIKSMKEWGLVLADSLASVVAVIILCIGIKYALKVKNGINKYYVIKCSIKFLIVSFIMAISIIIFKSIAFKNYNQMEYNVIEVVSCSLLGLTVYLIVSWILKIEEAINLFIFIRQKLLKRVI